MLVVLRGLGVSVTYGGLVLMNPFLSFLGAALQVGTTMSGFAF